LAVHYLIDAKAAKEGVRLNLFSPSMGASKEVPDKEYRPYFFVPHPLTRKDQETIEGLGAKTRVEEKRWRRGALCQTLSDSNRLELKSHRQSYARRISAPICR